MSLYPRSRITETSRRAAAWLASAGLRPTRQRLVLAELLVGDGLNRHVTAEGLHAASEAVSLATVYNTLRAFCEAGLMIEVRPIGERVLNPDVDDVPVFVHSWLNLNSAIRPP